MAKRKYTCPHCSKPIRVVSNRLDHNYLYCSDCNLRYIVDKPTNRFIAEYEPRKIVKFKGEIKYEDNM